MESFLTHAGYLALILFAFVEACSIPISSEITFGFAGVLAYQGHLNLALVIIIGTLAEFAGLVHLLRDRPQGRPSGRGPVRPVRAAHPAATSTGPSGSSPGAAPGPSRSPG